MPSTNSAAAAPSSQTLCSSSTYDLAIDKVQAKSVAQLRQAADDLNAIVEKALSSGDSQVAFLNRLAACERLCLLTSELKEQVARHINYQDLELLIGRIDTWCRSAGSLQQDDPCPDIARLIETATKVSEFFETCIASTYAQHAEAFDKNLLPMIRTFRQDYGILPIIDEEELETLDIVAKEMIGQPATYIGYTEAELRLLTKEGYERLIEELEELSGTSDMILALPIGADTIAIKDLNLSRFNDLRRLLERVPSACRSLTLDNCSLGRAAIYPLVNLLASRQIQHLGLPNNALSDEVGLALIKALEEGPGLGVLTHIDLRGNQLGDKSLVALFDLVEKSDKIKEIDLRQNSQEKSPFETRVYTRFVTDRVLEHQSLERVHIS